LGNHLLLWLISRSPSSVGHYTKNKKNEELEMEGIKNRVKRQSRINLKILQPGPHRLPDAAAATHTLCTPGSTSAASLGCSTHQLLAPCRLVAACPARRPYFSTRSEPRRRPDAAAAVHTFCTTASTSAASLVFSRASTGRPAIYNLRLYKMQSNMIYT
jgi:hypothetical protein